MSRVTAVFTILTLTIFPFLVNAVRAEEVLGWRVEWSTTVDGEGTVSWETGVDPIEAHSHSRSYSATFGGSYLTDGNGIVINGSATGSRLETTSGERLNWACGVGDNLQYVNTYGGTTISESITGPPVGGQMFIQEGPDVDTGEHGVRVTFPYSCSGEFNSWSEDYNAGSCAPRNDSNSSPSDTCWPPDYYAAGVQGTPADDTNQLFSGSGSEQVGCAYTDHYAATESCVGPITRTWQMTAEKIVAPSIHGIELTQAIQVYQTLDDLRAQLEKNDGNPPVPLVAYKPLAIRVMLEKMEETQQFIVEAYWNGWELDESPENLTQSATCPPPVTIENTTPSPAPSSRESLREDCRSADFYVEAPHPGMHEVRVILRTFEGEQVADEVLHIRAKESDTVVVGAVNICSRKTSHGRWDCLANPVDEVDRGVRLMREIFPTDQVHVAPTNHQIRLEVVGNLNGNLDSERNPDLWDCYDRTGKRVLGISVNDDDDFIVDDSTWPLSRITKCEGEMWWYVAAERVARLYGATSRMLEWTTGWQWFYFGMFYWDDLHGPWSGQAADIPDPDELMVDGPARGAIGESSHSATERDVKETVAHEFGHILGRRHTNIEADNTLAPCGFDWAEDSESDYPAKYPDSRLWSGHPYPDSGPIKRETGFHVKRKSIRDGAKYFDVMSYCSPQWISPFTYKKLHEVLDPPPVPPPGEAGDFWLVSGFVSEANAYLDAIFTTNTTGPVEEGQGTYRIEIRDGSDAVLFVRRFSPNLAQRDPKGPAAASQISLSSFAELVPVQASASRIVIVNESETVISDTGLSGAAPAIGITFPNGGEQLDGPHDITWSANDSDTDAHDLFYWVQYSADGGATWVNLAQDVMETSVDIDFDLLPGSDNALIRVLGTDGINTGTATSATFSVSRKLPTVEIALPEHGETVPVGGTVFFEGYGYDLESGRLPGFMHDWSSDRDGLLATANRFSTSDLSAGTHIIELLVLDGEGNTATDTIVLNVGELTDSDGDGDGVNDAADLCPNTPAGEAVDNDGCAASQRDSDGDGVSDADDQCPGTPAGTGVNSSGCTLSQPSPRPSGGGGGGSFDIAWIFFLWSWLYMRSRLGES